MFTEIYSIAYSVPTYCTCLPNLKFISKSKCHSNSSSMFHDFLRGISNMTAPPTVFSSTVGPIAASLTVETDYLTYLL